MKRIGLLTLLALGLAAAGAAVVHMHRASRPAVEGEAPPPSAHDRGRAVVTSAAPEASAAGAEILRAGGNAVDAAVAVSLALGVSEPAGSGLGGQTQWIVHPPDAPPFVLNGTSFAPAHVSGDAEVHALRGRTASTVPATLRTLGHAFGRFGSGRVRWSEVVAPAIRLAEEGVELGRFRQRALSKYADKLREDPASRETFLGPGGEAPRVGTRLTRPRLATTLRRVARAGADDFYEGELARAIADDMQRHGGWITREDLAQVPDPRLQEPLHITYGRWEVYSLPPPGGGWVVLQILNVLEQLAAGRAPDEATRLLRLAHALRQGHADRARQPIGQLRDHRSQTGDKLSDERASELAHPLDAAGETTHFCVVDGDGLVVGVTQSLNAYFGARVMHPTLGFLYNDYMHEFRDDPEHPFALEPGAMPYSSMSPTVVSQGGQPVLVLGSPGSARIISAVAQVAFWWMSVKPDIEQAVAAPRIHALPEGVVHTEVELPPAATRALGELDMRVQLRRSDLATAAGDPYFGGVHAAARQAGTWHGAADPRRDGAVMYVEP